MIAIILTVISFTVIGLSAALFVGAIKCGGAGGALSIVLSVVFCLCGVAMLFLSRYYIAAAVVMGVLK